jgi:malate dehydrogenase (oxaloacetate-decarboxylating)(NADP+)
LLISIWYRNRNKNTEEFIQTVKKILSHFWGINLEDIARVIWNRTWLVDELNIPVMHDDQHGTAITHLQHFKRAWTCWRSARYQNSHIRSWSAAWHVTHVLLGINPDNIIMFDKDGVLSSERTDMSVYNKYIKGKTRWL